MRTGPKLDPDIWFFWSENRNSKAVIIYKMTFMKLFSIKSCAIMSSEAEFNHWHAAGFPLN